MQITQPSKEQIREYLAARTIANTPPPNPADIRRQLGWNIIQSEKEICSTDDTCTR